MMIEDSREKKNIANSSKHRRTHCGKSGGVKLPSDFMTRKEIRAMNSEIRSYKMNEPMSWNEFKLLPDDLKIEYIKMLRSKFNVPDIEIAKFMGVSNSAFSKKARILGLGLGRDKSGVAKRWYKTEKAVDFYTWLGTNMPDPVENAEPTEVDNIDIHVDEAAKTIYTIATEPYNPILHCPSYARPKATPESGSLVFECGADKAIAMLADILGERKVQLNVVWHVCEDEATCECSDHIRKD